MPDQEILNKSSKKFFQAIIISTVIFLGVVELGAKFSAGERLFVIEEKILLKNIPEDTSDLHLWIPYPVSNNSQAISDFKIEAPHKSEFVDDEEYGNKFIYLKIEQKDLTKNPVKILLTFKVLRKELGVSDNPTTSKNLSRFLKSDRLVPVNGEIKRIAQKITQGKKGNLERVRAIYDYIIDELTYSKDDPTVCGIGDSLLTLQYKKGICTDYHSLFISLVRSLGIPAKFEIGFRLPEDTQEGELNGYHCWAKFYLQPEADSPSAKKDKGWIPVDISEADKHPQKRDYFFGNIDENRVHLTSGRDIELKYAKDSQPLNFFVYPYAELNGKQFNDMDIQISYKDLRYFGG